MSSFSPLTLPPGAIHDPIHSQQTAAYSSGGGVHDTKALNAAGALSKMNSDLVQLQHQQLQLSSCDNFHHSLSTLATAQILSQLGVEKYHSDKIVILLGQILIHRLESHCRVLKMCYENNGLGDLCCYIEYESDDVGRAKETESPPGIHPSIKSFLQLELGPDYNTPIYKDIAWYIQEQNQWIHYILAKITGDTQTLQPATMKKPSTVASSSALYTMQSSKIGSRAGAITSSASYSSAPVALLNLFNTLPGQKQKLLASASEREKERKRQKEGDGEGPGRSAETLKGFEDLSAFLPPLPKLEQKTLDPIVDVQKVIEAADIDDFHKKGNPVWQDLDARESDHAGDYCVFDRKGLFSAMSAIEKVKGKNDKTQTRTAHVQETTESEGVSLLEVELKPAMPADTRPTFQLLREYHMDPKFLIQYFTQNKILPCFSIYDAIPSVLEGLVQMSEAHFGLSVSPYWLSELLGGQTRRAKAPAIHFTFKRKEDDKGSSSLALNSKVEVVVITTKKSPLTSVYSMQDQLHTASRSHTADEESWEGLDNILEKKKKVHVFSSINKKKGAFSIHTLHSSSMNTSHVLSIPKLKLNYARTSLSAPSNHEPGYKVKLPALKDALMHKKKDLIKAKPSSQTSKLSLMKLQSIKTPPSPPKRQALLSIPRLPKIKISLKPNMEANSGSKRKPSFGHSASDSDTTNGHNLAKRAKLSSPLKSKRATGPSGSTETLSGETRPPPFKLPKLKLLLKKKQDATSQKSHSSFSRLPESTSAVREESATTEQREAEVPKLKLKLNLFKHK